MDRQVIELLRTKDEEGIRLLQKQYANLLYYIVYPILQSKEETEECLSDIYSYCQKYCLEQAAKEDR